MILPTGATSVSVDVGIYDDTGLPVTGLVAATFPAVTWSLAGAHADNALSLSDLATLTTAWASGGVKERGNGVYRLDLPDAAFAAAGEVKVRGEATGKHLVTPSIDVGVQASVAAGGISNASFVTAPGAAGGLLIAGSNADTTFASVTCTASFTISDGWLVSRSSSNLPAISATGNGTGAGFLIVGGAFGDGQHMTAGTGATAFNAQAASGTGMILRGGGGGRDLTVSQRITNLQLPADGLDLLSVADPGAPAAHTTLPKMLVAVWRALWKKDTLTASQWKRYADDGTTPNATSAVSDDGTTQTKGEFS